MPKTYSIVGMNHRDSEYFVKGLQAGIDAVLVREPHNKFDANAVAVWINRRHVGYVPKAQNKVLAAFIDQAGRNWTAPIAADLSTSAMDANITVHRAVDAKFVRSPNSGYPMVEV